MDGRRIHTAPPWLGTLVVPTVDGKEERFKLTDLATEAPAIPRSFLPVKTDRAGQVQANGSWFEWVVGVALAEAGLDEVWVQARHNPTGTRGTKDEMDVLTRCEGAYVHWSCKTTGSAPAIDAAAAQARSQADLFLGRGSWAAVAVPRVTEPSAAWEERGEGWWGIDDKVDLIDARMLERPAQLRELALLGSGKSR